MPHTNFSPEAVLALRTALGSGPKDTSHDDLIYNMTPEEALEHLCEYLLTTGTFKDQIRQMLWGLGLEETPVSLRDIDAKYTVRPKNRLKQESMEELIALALSRIQGFDFVDVSTFKEAGFRDRSRRFGVILEIPGQVFIMPISQATGTLDKLMSNRRGKAHKDEH